MGAELKFVPSSHGTSTPIAASLTLKKSMRALKLGEQVASIPGLTLVLGVLRGNEEGETYLQLIEMTGNMTNMFGIGGHVR